MNTLSAIPIKRPYIDWILDGTKTWEIRSKNATSKIGPVGLIQSGSGTVVGTATLVRVIPLNRALARANARRMGMTTSEAARCAGRYAWVLDNVVRLRKPVPYVRRRGQVTWVTLDATTARKVKAEAASSRHMAIVSRHLKVRQANIDHNHLYLTKVLDIFPEDVFGGSDESQAATRTVRVQCGSELIETDIDSTKRIFRKRGWVAKFFNEARVKAEDWILVEQLEPYLYRVSKA